MIQKITSHLLPKSYIQRVPNIISNSSFTNIIKLHIIHPTYAPTLIYLIIIFALVALLSEQALSDNRAPHFGNTS